MPPLTPPLTFTIERPKPDPWLVALIAQARANGGKLEFSQAELEDISQRVSAANCFYTLHFDIDADKLIFETAL